MPREWGCEWLVLRRRTSQSTRLVLAVLAVLAVLRGTDGSSGDHIFGAGATFPAQLYRDAMFAYGFVADVDVTYLPVGSTGGICRILDGSEACDEKGAPYEVHFAGSDAPLEEEHYAQMDDLKMYPTVAGAVAAVYSHPQVDAVGKPLVLSMVTLAMIFGGEIRTWGDSRIIADQEHPEVVAALSSAPDTPIEVVVRADGSGTTSIWTSALVRSLDLAGLSNPFIAASPDPDSAWLNPDVSFTRRDGNPGVSAYTSSKPYAIGYTVLGYALEADMSLVHVRTAHSVVAPSISAVEYAVAERGLSFNVPGRLTADLTGATGTSAWPAAGYTYLVVRTRTDIFADCNLRRELVLFWEWFYTDPVPRNLARLNGFAPLPEMVREVVVDALIDDVQCSDGSQALVPLQEGAILAFTGPRMLGGIMTLYGEIYQTAGSLVTVSYEDASTALSAPDWLALAQDMAPRSALLATLSTEGATWWGDGTGLVAAPFVRLRTGLFVHACDDDVACVPQAPREVSRETVARIAAGDIAGPAVWEALGLSFGVAPRVLCPRVGTSDRAVLERAVAEAWPGASVGGCEEASQQEMDQALLAFPGTVAFHLHTATTLEEGEVAEVPIAGSMAWDQDVFIVAKRDQGTCDPDGRALAHFLGWIFGHPSVIGDGEENIDYSLPLNGTGLVPIGYNGSAWQALETMECDGQPILESSAGSGGMGALEYVAIILPTAVVVAVGAVVYVVLSRRQKRQWGIKLSELRFFDPEVVVGVGAFSRVALAKYRGSLVAVKKYMPNAWGRQRPLHSSGVADPEAQAQAKRQGTGVSAMYDGETTQAVGSRWWVRAKAHPASTVDLSELSESKWVRGSLRMTASSLRRGQVHVGPGGMSTWGYVRRQLKLDFRREIEIISKLRHPNIVTMIGATFQGDNLPMLVMEHMAWGSLLDVISNPTLVIEPEQALDLLRDIARGMTFLHLSGVAHNDLKAANVLVDARLTAKISDFGFSHTRASTKLYGSPFWMAPEILRGDGRSRFRADVYSFAITAAELLSRRTPFSGLPAGKVLSQVADPAIEPPFRPRLPDAVPRALKELICLCWAHDPSRRPTFEEIGRALEQMPADALSGVFPQDDVGSELGGAGEAALPGAIRAELERPGVKAYQKPMRMLCVMVLTVADATEIAAKLGDGALLENLLSRLFGAVDEEAASVGAVTVMGTGHYVAIVGLNGERDEEQAMRICNLAVRAGTIARDTLVREGFPVMGKVRLRAGVHIAPATAAVVGSRARRFAVLGDAVHVATELEAASQPQRVLLSDAVAMALKRGDPTGLGANVVRHKIVNVRGKGPLPTHWLSAPGERSGLEFSIGNGAGTQGDGPDCSGHCHAARHWDGGEGNGDAIPEEDEADLEE